MFENQSSDSGHLRARDRAGSPAEIAARSGIRAEARGRQERSVRRRGVDNG